MRKFFPRVQESSEFHKRSFETAVASLKAIAASHLWQVTNTKVNFSRSLKKIHLWIFAISAACGCMCRLGWTLEGS